MKLAVSVFGATLKYDDIAISDKGLPGPTRSHAPWGVIHAIRNDYRGDYSESNTPFFIHELTHVWQHQHGVSVALRGILLAATAWVYRTCQYDYALKAGDRFSDFNIEQQAAIVARTWANATGCWKDLSLDELHLHCCVVRQVLPAEFRVAVELEAMP